MKKAFFYIAAAVAAITAVSLLFNSCKKDPEDKVLFGKWEERYYKVYDTAYISYTQHFLELMCPEEYYDSTVGRSVKTGEFKLRMHSVHHPQLPDTSNKLTVTTFPYEEYVYGWYILDSHYGRLDLSGKYYTDSSYTTLCTLENTSHTIGDEQTGIKFQTGFGNYNRKTTYKIDETELTLNLNDATGCDLNTFIVVEQNISCLGN